MPSQTPVRFGTIGFGIMGERMLRSATAHDPAVLTVAGAWDPSAEAMQRLQRELPQVQRFASLDALLAACDAVHIASPPTYHLEQMEAAVAAGVAVLCEKPLAVDVPRARSTVERLAAVRGRTAVNFPFTSSFGVDQITAWCNADIIGDLQSVHIEAAFAQWPRPWQMAAANWLSKRAEGGFTREVLSHFLFLTLRQIGPVTLQRVSVTYPANGDAETAVTAQLEAVGIPVTVSANVGGTSKADQNLWVLQGSRGQIRLRDWAIAEHLQSDGTWQAPATPRSNEEMRPLVLQRQLDKLAAMIRGEPQNLATLAEALAVQEVVEAMLQSSIKA